MIISLEKELCNYHNSKYCISFGSGFWALVKSIKIKSIKTRSQVLIPSLTYRRLSDAVFWSGKTPKFVDICPKNLAISPTSIKKAINSKTSLILAVHPIVNTCDVNKIIEISDNYSIPLLFDAVESVHETINRKRVGSFGVGEIFSLHASKLINGIEGGYVCTNNSNFAKTLIDARKGTSIFGFSNHLPITHAIFALNSLKDINKLLRHNKKIYKSYKKHLKNIGGIKLLEFDESEQTSYKNIIIKIKESNKIIQEKIIFELNQDNILARPYYSPPLHKKKYKYNTVIEDMSSTEKLEFSYINLPCGYRMNERATRMVCEKLKTICLHILNY